MVLHISPILMIKLWNRFKVVILYFILLFPLSIEVLHNLFNSNFPSKIMVSCSCCLIKNLCSYFTRLLMFQTIQIAEPDYLHIGCSTQCLSIYCTFENRKPVLSCIQLGSCFLLKYHHRKVRSFRKVRALYCIQHPSLKEREFYHI